ncbi:MAG: prepilin-type N-terminal cleavage/methylation domain-containing protein [Sedimentisphaerales bacterium]|nr:prepilin-type N-terminal cleavage/methylation domain-containing protein [Sedimentisphaerales bacterium]
MRTKNGFTLIELLVVIAIIGLLVSILMPALTGARKQAQSAACMSHLKQMGYATYYYAEDNKNYVPRGTGGYNDPLVAQKRWFHLLIPYLDQDTRIDTSGVIDYSKVKIFRCPGYPAQKDSVICYAINNWAEDEFGQNVEASQPTKLEAFRGRPDELIYLADLEDSDELPQVTTSDNDSGDYMDVYRPEHMPYIDVEHPFYGRRIARDRHNGGSNCLFLDWHVENVGTYDMNFAMWSGRPQDRNL